MGKIGRFKGYVAQEGYFYFFNIDPKKAVHKRVGVAVFIFYISIKIPPFYYKVMYGLIFRKFYRFVYFWHICIFFILVGTPGFEPGLKRPKRLVLAVALRPDRAFKIQKKRVFRNRNL